MLQQMPVGSEAVQRLFSQPIPERVWHYTDLAGFEGICASSRVWATDVYFTNDETEFVHSQVVAQEFLRTYVPLNHSERDAVEIAKKVVAEVFETGSLSSERAQVFVASFSSAPDLKSQWMEYAANATGVAIGFDLSAVRPPERLKLGITVAPCIYGGGNKRMLVGDVLGQIIREYAHLSDKSWIEAEYVRWKQIYDRYKQPLNAVALKLYARNIIHSRLRSAHSRMTFDLLRLASHFKESSFSQEQEWRLAMPRPKSRPLIYDRILYRGPERSIPYIASSLFSQRQRLPITCVMLGPLCTEQAAIQTTLASSGYDVPLLRSAIPLRRSK